MILLYSNGKFSTQPLKGFFFDDFDVINPEGKGNDQVNESPYLTPSIVGCLIIKIRMLL